MIHHRSLHPYFTPAFQVSLENITRLNLDLLNRAITRASLDGAKLVDNVHALHDLAKDSVLAVKVRGGAQRDED